MNVAIHTFFEAVFVFVISILCKNRTVDLKLRYMTLMPRNIDLGAATFNRLLEGNEFATQSMFLSYVIQLLCINSEQMKRKHPVQFIN